MRAILQGKNRELLRQRLGSSPDISSVECYFMNSNHWYLIGRKISQFNKKLFKRITNTIQILISFLKDTAKITKINLRILKERFPSKIKA